MTGTTIFISIVLFHFIFDLLSILMMMANIKKVELIKTFIKIFFLTKIFVYRLNYGLSVPFLFDQDKGFTENMAKKTSSGILSNTKIVNFVECAEHFFGQSVFIHFCC